MRIHRFSILATIILGVAACRPPATEFTESEALNRLSLDTVPSRVELHFAPGAARLSAGEAERLRHTVAAGVLGTADRVTLSVSGTSHLAEARGAAIRAELLRYGIVTTPLQLAALPSDRAVLGISRTVVTLPPCPNWSKEPNSDFTNALSSNFGCATTTNLGRMVANPTDLVSGRPHGDPDATTAVSALTRYYTDKIQLPTAATIGPIAAPSSGTPGGGGGGGSPGSQ